MPQDWIDALPAKTQKKTNWIDALPDKNAYDPSEDPMTAQYYMKHRNMTETQQDSAYNSARPDRQPDILPIISTYKPTGIQQIAQASQQQNYTSPITQQSEMQQITNPIDKTKSYILNNPILKNLFNNNNFDISVANPERQKLNQQFGGGGSIEAWFPNDEGVSKFVNPNLGKYNIEIYNNDLLNNQDELNKTVFRDVLHYLPQLDSNWNKMRNEFAQNFSSKELDFLKNKFDKEKSDNETFGEWMDRTMIDGYIRGGFDENSDYGKLFNGTYKENGKTIEAYTPKQKEILKKMRDYIGFSSNNTNQNLVTQAPRSRQIDPITQKVLSYLLAPVESAVYGVRGAGDTAEKTVEAFKKGDIGSGALGTLATALQGSMSVATPFVPVMSGFATGNKVASDVLGEKAINTVMAPIETLTQPTSLAGKSGAQIGDLLYNLLLFGGANKGVKALKDRFAVPETVPKNIQPTEIKSVEPQQENIIPNAEQQTKINPEVQSVQKPSTTQEIPRTGKGGENISTGSERVRPSEQGQEITGKSKTPQIQGQQKVDNNRNAAIDLINKGKKNSEILTALGLSRTKDNVAQIKAWRDEATISNTFDQAGARYEGQYPDGSYSFTNKKTGGTFTIKPEDATPENIKKILANDKNTPLTEPLPPKATKEEISQAFSKVAEENKTKEQPQNIIETQPKEPIIPAQPEQKPVQEKQLSEITKNIEDAKYDLEDYIDEFHKKEIQNEVEQYNKNADMPIIKGDEDYRNIEKKTLNNYKNNARLFFEKYLDLIQGKESHKSMASTYYDLPNNIKIRISDHEAGSKIFQQDLKNIPGLKEEELRKHQLSIIINNKEDLLNKEPDGWIKEKTNDANLPTELRFIIKSKEAFENARSQIEDNLLFLQQKAKELVAPKQPEQKSVTEIQPLNKESQNVTQEKLQGRQTEISPKKESAFALFKQGKKNSEVAQSLSIERNKVNDKMIRDWRAEYNKTETPTQIEVPKGSNAVIVKFKDGRQSKLPVKDLDTIGTDYSNIQSFSFGSARTKKTGGLNWDTFTENKKVERNKSGELQSALIPGVKEFIEQDITPNIQKAYSGIRATTDLVKKAFAPASRTPESKLTAAIIRENAAKLARKREIAYNSYKEVAKAFDKKGENYNLDLIDKAENGIYDEASIDSKIMKEMQTTLSDKYKSIQEQKGGSGAFIENYFPHIWEDPVKAGSEFAKIYAKKPLEGSKAFLKQRKIPTIKEGIELGLKPVSTNPVDLFLAKNHEMDKYIMAHDIFNDFKERGLTKFVRMGQKPPDGWKPLNDKIGKVFQYSANEKGLVARGQYYMPEQAATILNNYLSPGLGGNVGYQLLRKSGNLMNQFQLGLSAFHASFTTADAIISKTALGLQKISQGRILEGTKDIISTPITPITNFLKGNKLLKAYYEKNPELTNMVDNLMKAGGRVRMDSFFKNNAVEGWRKAWRTGNAWGGVVRTPGALVESLSKPLMEELVPRQKLGVFFDLAKNINDEAVKKNWSNDLLRERLQEAWDSVDNRMGQMVYDNLFWNKSLKDLGMASVRSLGWNIGDIRELGGAPIDAIKQIKSAVTGKGIRITPRMAYAISLPIITGTLGGITNYLYTGEPPKELKDYFFPRTGKINPDGTPERISLPTYMKDVYAYAQKPLTTVSHKLHPLISSLVNMFENQDYYGYEIRNPDDPLVQQFKQEMEYLGKQFVPFSIQGLQRRSEAGETKGQQMQSLLGLNPAPKYLSNTSLQNKIEDLYKTRFSGGTKPYEQKAIDDAKRDIRISLRAKNVTEARQKLEKYVNDGLIDPNSKSTKMLFGTVQIPFDEYAFKRLPVFDKIDILKNADDNQFKKYIILSNDKVLNDPEIKKRATDLKISPKRTYKFGKTPTVKGF